MRAPISFWTTRNLPSTSPFNIWKDFDQFFDDVSSRPVATTNEFLPPAEFSETEKSYLFSFDLPGLKKEEIKIEMFENTLTVSGERKQEKHFEDQQTQRVEKSYGSFKRSFALPKNADSDKVEAKYENGVLELMIPKIEAAPVKKISVS